MKYFILTLVNILITALAMAQGGGNAEMADEMRSSGKIYVVIAIILIIFAGIILYLVRLDRRISRMEKHSS